MVESQRSRICVLWPALGIRFLSERGVRSKPGQNKAWGNAERLQVGKEMQSQTTDVRKSWDPWRLLNFLLSGLKAHHRGWEWQAERMRCVTKKKKKSVVWGNRLPVRETWKDRSYRSFERVLVVKRNFRWMVFLATAPMKRIMIACLWSIL